MVAFKKHLEQLRKEDPFLSSFLNYSRYFQNAASTLEKSSPYLDYYNKSKQPETTVLALPPKNVQVRFQGLLVKVFSLF